MNHTIEFLLIASDEEVLNRLYDRDALLWLGKKSAIQHFKNGGFVEASIKDVEFDQWLSSLDDLLAALLLTLVLGDTMIKNNIRWLPSIT